MKEPTPKERNLGFFIAEFEHALHSKDYLAHAQSFEHLEEFDNLLLYLSSEGSKRRNYRHYATRKRIDNIISERALYLTDGSTWNDAFDKDHFNPPSAGIRRFGICLSATTSESIAMWMLYGGMDGNGSMINFNHRTLNRAMQANSYECGHFENKQFICDMTLKSDDIKFELADILYFDTNSNSDLLTVERIGEPLVSIQHSILDEIPFIFKHRAWSYEKEVRFVANISPLELGENFSKVSAIKIPLVFDNDFIKNRVFDSPASDGTGHFRSSELHGTVNWDLCASCNRAQQ